ncbi:hypothetical protein [Schaalia canis]|uniref:Uncharacterized protein n=1 Tax=Schaalia canis TaxID=100469 RepID=A0A3P1SEY3_9ACTO|nr:hypothetical protein [Schaalia canis]RRC94872.1 hypothetical protein EII11_08340 [Schaalia canis]
MTHTAHSSLLSPSLQADRRYWKRWGACAALIPLISFSAGCAAMSGGDEDASAARSAELYAADFEQARQRTANAPLAQEILADNRITEAEMIGMLDLWSTCMQDNGVTGYQEGLDPDSLKWDDSVPWEVYERAQENCIAKTGYFEVSILYRSITVNPENYNWSALTVQCLTRNQVLEPGFTAEQYDKVAEDFGRAITEDSVVAGGPSFPFLGDPATAEWIHGECSRDHRFDRQAVSEPAWVDMMRRERNGETTENTGSTGQSSAS